MRRPSCDNWKVIGRFFIPERISGENHLKRKLILTKLLYGVFALILIFSVYKTCSYLFESDTGANYSSELQSEAVVWDTHNSDTISSDADAASGAMSGSSAPEEQIPESVDFESLQKISKNCAAWIFCPDSKINYPVAHGTDDAYYLHRLLNGKKNNGGTLFIEAENQKDFSDWNTIIYGHNMKNGTMFGDLTEYEDQSYYEAHPVMYLYTPDKRWKMELIAGFVTDTSSDIYQIPKDEEAKMELVNTAEKKSDFKTDVTVQEKDRLVTLSTCSYEKDDARYVVIGKLVEW